MKNFFKWGCLTIVVLVVAAALGGLWIWKGTKTSNPRSYAVVGDIPTPMGYHRINENDGFAAYLRALPLKEKGAKIQLYNNGGDANFQSLNYAVIDIPVISNDEQCADMTMRFRAEYLYSRGLYSSIHFNNVGGKRMNYSGGANRKAFERYMRKTYGVASTFSLCHEMQPRDLSDIQPGDVFVYSGAERNQQYGHAVTVVDVAENSKGDRVFMIAEGNTPAREAHIVRNWFNPVRSPWFSMDPDAKVIQLSPYTFFPQNLKHW